MGSRISRQWGGSSKARIPHLIFFFGRSYLVLGWWYWWKKQLAKKTQKQHYEWIDRLTKVASDILESESSARDITSGWWCDNYKFYNSRGNDENGEKTPSACYHFLSNGRHEFRWSLLQKNGKNVPNTLLKILPIPLRECRQKVQDGEKHHHPSDG